MTGSAEDTFSPGGKVSCGAALDALFRMSGAQDSFSDPAAWAADAGLSGELAPEEILSRRQLAQLLQRFVRSGMAPEENEASDPMEWANAHALFRPRTIPVPDAPVTRAVLAHALCALRNAAGA